MRVRQERLPLLAAGGALAFLLLAYVARGSHGAVIAIGLVAIVAATYLGYLLRPSVFLTIGLALEMFSGNWQNVGVAGLPIKPDRLLILIGLVGLIARVPAAAKRGPIRLGPAHFLILLATTYAVISALLSGTLTTSEGFFGLLDRFGLVPYIMFLIAPVAFAEERDRDILLVGLTVMGGYLGLTALFETTGPTGLVIPHYISDPNLGIHAERARGPFIEAVAMGLSLSACGGAAALAFFRWRGVARALCAVVAALCAMGVLFTVTRSIWIGSAVSVLVVLVAFRELRRFALPVILLTGVVVGGAYAFVPSLSAKADTRAKDQLPIWDRRNTNATAVRMAEKRPLFGFGWNTFVDKSPPYFRLAADYPITGLGKGVHNVVLSNLAELGLVGAFLWLAALMAGVGGALTSRGPPELRGWRILAVAVAVQWFVAAMLGPLAYALPNLLLWTLAGITLADPRPADD